VLNWTPVVIADFFLGTFFIVGGIWSLRTSENVKIRTIKYLKAVWITFAVYFYLQAISFLLLDLFWGRIYGIIGYVAMAFLIIAISYNYKDSLISIWLLVNIVFGFIAAYLAFTQPDAAKIEMVDGYYQVIWTGAFDLLATIIIIIFAFVYFLWIVITLLFSPYILRRYAFYYLIGGLFSMILSLIIYYFIESLFWTEISICFGLLICNYIIYKQPGILYILPFKAYRLTVFNKNGDILIKSVWSRTSSIDHIYDILKSTKSENLEKIKSSLYLPENNIGKSSNKFKLVGMIKDIKNPKGYKLSKDNNSKNIILEMRYPEILVYESKFIIVKFEVSKITTFLRDLVVQFSNEFDIEFREELENSIIEKEKYETGYQLINRYFYMFPSNIITSSKDSLLISPESFRIDKKLEKKISEIFPDENDFNFIKCEIQRAPKTTLKIVNKIWEEMQIEKERS